MFGACFIAAYYEARQIAISKRNYELAEEQRLLSMPHEDRMLLIELKKARAMEAQATASLETARAIKNQKLSIF